MCYHFQKSLTRFYLNMRQIFLEGPNPFLLASGHVIRLALLPVLYTNQQNCSSPTKKCSHISFLGLALSTLLVSFFSPFLSIFYYKEHYLSIYCYIFLRIKKGDSPFFYSDLFIFEKYCNVIFYKIIILQ